MDGERQERPKEWPDPPEEETEETEETEEAEKPDDPSLLVWEPVAQTVPDEMPQLNIWRARTPVGWVVAAFQEFEGKEIETLTGRERVGAEHEMVGFTFVPDFGSNNMTKNKWE